MISATQIRKIHTLKNVIGLDDDLYLDMLMSFDVQTSKDLTYAEAVIFIEILEEKAIALNRWVRSAKKYADIKRDTKMATPAQLRMIEGMWRDICYFDNDKFAKKSLRKFLKTKFKTDDIFFLTKAKAIKVIRAIKGIKQNLKSARESVPNLSEC